MGLSHAYEYQGMRRNSSPVKLQSGFTLIELITVILLVGILSVVAVPRIFDMAAFNARGLQDATLSFLRYAQKTAIAQRRVVCLGFTSNSATLNISAVSGSTACNTPLRGPTGDFPGTLTAKTGVFYAAHPAGVNFNGLGQPVDASGAALATQTLQVKGMSSAITVEAVTGYVHE
jgi:MSHA pilin protein MshC